MTDPLALSRRDVLRLLAGLPLVVGLPRPARAAGDEEDPAAPAPPPTLAGALAAAAARGRPVLLVALPVGDDPPRFLGGPDEGQDEGPPRLPGGLHGRRQRLARHLDALLSSKDEATRLAVANLVVVVAPADALRRAAPGLPPGGLPPGDDAADASPVWLVEAPSGRARRLEGALDDDDAAAAAVVDAARAAAVPADREALAARRGRELAALGPDRAAVERDLAALGAATATDRDAASARLAGRADAVVAALTLLAVDPAGDDEVRARARDLVLRVASAAVPVGGRWGEFVPGCGVHDPYAEEESLVECGMAKVREPTRRYLQLLAE